MFLLLFRTIIFLFLTIILIPFQLFIVLLLKKLIFFIPNFYHKLCCKIFGIKLEIKGNISDFKPTLFVSNHSSYMDIVILSSLFKTSFIAKKEVSRWPFFGILAKLQKTVFIDRKISSIKKQENLITSPLEKKNNLVIFPEGTSSDGNKVLPFKSSLFNIFDNKYKFKPRIQTVTIIYKKINGMPLNRNTRKDMTWHSNMELLPNMINLFSKFSIDVEVIFGKEFKPNNKLDRKKLAFFCWQNINNTLINSLYR